jgi:hypothetical protein
MQIEKRDSSRVALIVLGSLDQHIVVAFLFNRFSHQIDAPPWDFFSQAFINKPLD